MTVQLLRVLPFLFLELPEHGSPAALLALGLRAAAAGDPVAWDFCTRLVPGDGSGMCKVAASAAMPDRGAACDRIVRAYWRDECWFEFAEHHAQASRWDDAIAACRKAGQFDRDCARHIWWTAQLDGPPDRALLERLAASFEVDADYIEQGAEAFREAAEGVVAGEAREEAARQALAEQARVAAQREADPVVQEARRVERWREHFLEQLRVDTSSCPDDERAACVSAARAEFGVRWERAVERSDSARRLLCEGRGQVGQRLRPHEDVELLAVLDELRPRVCATKPAAE